MWRQILNINQDRVIRIFPTDCSIAYVIFKSVNPAKEIFVSILLKFYPSCVKMFELKADLLTSASLRLTLIF